MIDSVLIAQGVLAGLTVILRMSLFAIGLVLLAVILYVVSKRYGKFKRTFRGLSYLFGVLGISLIIILLISIFGFSHKEQHYDFSLDLTKQRGIDLFAPDQCKKSIIGETPSYDCIFEGEVDLNLSLNDNRNIHDIGRLLWVVGDTKRTHTITFFSKPKPYQEILKSGRNLISNWHLTDSLFVEWQKKNESGNLETLKHYVRPVDPVPDPQLEFSIVPVESNPGEWFISYHFYWKQDGNS